MVAKLLIQVQWIYSEVKFCEQAIKTFDEAIKLHEVQVTNLKKHLEEIREPFSLIFNNELKESTEIEDEQAFIQSMTDPNWKKVYMMEQTLVKRLDPMTEALAANLGYTDDEFPGFLFSSLIYVNYFYIIITIMTSFIRPDFLNLTIGCIATLMLNNVRTLRRKHFRLLVFGIILSLCYDMIWLPLEWETYEDDLDESVSEGKVH